MRGSVPNICCSFVQKHAQMFAINKYMLQHTFQQPLATQLHFFDFLQPLLLFPLHCSGAVQAAMLQQNY